MAQSRGVRARSVQIMYPDFTILAFWEGVGCREGSVEKNPSAGRQAVPVGGVNARGGGTPEEEVPREGRGRQNKLVYLPDTNKPSTCGY